jgi:photosystem II stability/assembly factor-like uncharacterized protein
LISSLDLILKVRQGNSTWSSFKASSAAFVLLLLNSPALCQWSTQTSGTTAILNAVYFVSENNGWAVGDAGKILTTANGATTWSAQSSGTTEFLGSVFFVSQTTGWVGGGNGKILSTANGGATWTPQASGTTIYLNSIQFTSPTVGWAVGYNYAPLSSVILKTLNGGASWTTVTNAPFVPWQSVYFVSASTGWIVGGTLVGGVIVKTTDAGSSWAGLGASTGVTSVHFKSATTGWVVGALGLIAKTTDAGANWVVKTSGTSNNLYSVCFTSQATGWAVGDRGTILKTIDGGNTWAAETSGTTKNLLSVHFPTVTTGYAVGMDGTILKRTGGSIALSPPILLSPANGATNQLLPLTLDWSDVGGATSYHVQVSRNQSFTSLVSDASGLSASQYTIGGLSADTTYYWRVNATDGITTSAWSDIWTFTVSPALQLTLIPAGTVSLNQGDPYLFSISVKSNGVPVSNANVRVVNSTTARIDTLPTNVHGECIYTSFVPANVSNLYCTFEASKSGYQSSGTVQRTLSASNPQVGGPDETDAMGICPTRIITGNGHNILNFSKEGKLIALFTPTVGSWNVIPYTTSNDIGTNALSPLFGAPEHEGLFAGIEIDSIFKWFWQLPYPQISYPEDDNPTVKIRYTIPFEDGDVEVVMTCVAGHGDDFRNANLQSYEIQNSTTTSRAVRFVFYGFVHPTKKNQQPPLTDLLGYFSGWSFGDPGETEATRIDGQSVEDIVTVKPTAGLLNDGQFLCLGVTIGGSANIQPISDSRFSAINTEQNNFGVYSSNGIDFRSTNNSAHSTKVNWAARYNLDTIRLADTRTVNVFVASGLTNEAARSGLQNAILANYSTFLSNSKHWWSTQPFQSKIANPNLNDPVEKNMLKRWVITCRMLVDTDSGAIVASPNRQPKYYATWVRDGIFQALLWELLDQSALVNNYLSFLIKASDSPLLHPNWRYWRQCYSILPPNCLGLPFERFQGVPFLPNNVDPDPLKIGAVEEDQMGEFLWALFVISKHRDSSDVRHGRPTSITIENVRQIADYIVSRINHSSDGGKIVGLLEPSVDWYEFPENNGTLNDMRAAFHDQRRAAIGQSIVTNSAAVAGLISASILAEDQTYWQRAMEVKAALVLNYKDDSNPSRPSFNPPSYVELVYPDFSIIPPSFPLDHFATSTRYQLHLNNFSMVWPFKVLENDADFATRVGNFTDTVNTLLRSLKNDPVKKCFTPPYLMFALFELYQNNPNSGKIEEIVRGVDRDSVKYVPETFYYDNGFRFRVGATPLGWSNAWAALALLAKADVRFPDLMTSARATAPIPTDRKLDNSNVFVYPNPFNPDKGIGSIVFGLGKPATVTIKIYDVSNTLVRTIDAGNLPLGSSHAVAWDGKSNNGRILANGVYFYIIESSAGERGVGKLALLR